MPTIVIKTQAELDSLPAKFGQYTYIEIRSAERIRVSVARGNSSVVARENSSVEAWGNSSVEARENSSVVARGNSSVVARENSSVEAWGNSSVEARENSSVEAWGNSSVEAWGNCCARLFSAYSRLRLHGYSVCFVLAAGAVPEKKSETATVITPERYKDTFGWLDQHGVEIVKPDCVILYKRVSKDYKTQELEPWETTWKLGSILTHPAWNPTGSECSGGKFHACPRPYFCDEFRNTKADKYIAVKIHTKDLHAWIENPSYPNKIAFRRGKVLYEVDRMGRKIGVAK